MAETTSGEPRTAPLVVECATWRFAVGYATSRGHTSKPRVVREDGPGGGHWAIHVQVPCGPPAKPAGAVDALPRATAADPRDFWRLLRDG